MQQIDGFWFPTRLKLEQKQAKEWIANASDWEVCIPYIKNWSCAVDGGAHVGLWTIRLAGHFETVHAFEPDASNFECLKLNTAELKNVVLHNCALGEKQRKAGITGVTSTGLYLHKGSNVSVYPLDTFGLSPGLIKLDVEGSESHALQGAVETLKAHPVVMLEDKYFSRYDQPHPERFLPGYKKITEIRRDRVYIHDRR